MSGVDTSRTAPEMRDETETVSLEESRMGKHFSESVQQAKSTAPAKPAAKPAAAAADDAAKRAADDAAFEKLVARLKAAGQTEKLREVLAERAGKGVISNPSEEKKAHFPRG